MTICCNRLDLFPQRIGYIAQGATNWLLEDSLAEQLIVGADLSSAEALAQLLLAHKFPLALAQQPLASLSPGERVRAALICLFQRAPTMDVLVLDEPTCSLDFVGLAALTESLRAWPGGLVVASHNRDFLNAIDVTEHIALGSSACYVDRAIAGHESSQCQTPPNISR